MLLKSKNIIAILFTIVILFGAFLCGNLFSNNSNQNAIGYYPLENISGGGMTEVLLPASHPRLAGSAVVAWNDAYLCGMVHANETQPQTLYGQKVPTDTTVVKPAVYFADREVFWNQTYDYKFYQGYGNISKILPLNDGGYLVFVNCTPFTVKDTHYDVPDAIIKCNADGTVAKQIQMTVNGIFAKFVYETAEGDILIVSEDEQPIDGYAKKDVVVHRLNSNLDILLTHRLGGTEDDEVYNAVFSENGFVIEGYSKSTNTDFISRGTFMAGFDKFGNRIWLQMAGDKTEELLNHKTMLLFNDHFLVMGYRRLYCFGFDGELQWETKISNNDKVITDSLFLLSDDKICLRYNEANEVDRYHFLIIDKNGKVLDTYNDTNGQTISAKADDKGGFALQTKRNIGQQRDGTIRYESVITKYDKNLKTIYRKTYSEIDARLLSPTETLVNAN